MFKTLTINDGEIIPSVHQDEHWLQEKFLFAGDYDIDNFPSHIPGTEVQFLVIDNGDSLIIAEFVKNDDVFTDISEELTNYVKTNPVYINLDAEET